MKNRRSMVNKNVTVHKVFSPKAFIQLTLELILWNWKTNSTMLLFRLQYNARPFKWDRSSLKRGGNHGWRKRQTITVKFVYPAWGFYRHMLVTKPFILEKIHRGPLTIKQYWAIVGGGHGEIPMQWNWLGMFV